MQPSSQSPAIEKLGHRLKRRWPTIEKSLRSTDLQRRKISSLLNQILGMDSEDWTEDWSIVAFGSIARNEWTTGSDLDWTLLIDGMARTGHFGMTQDIAHRLQLAKFKRPGPTGVFGNMAFSHDIIHRIGGENDTNRNTTQRILLLLESTVIGGRAAAHERVIRGILERYLEEDTSFLTPGSQKYKVPRFLLNDIVRFWRTMAVDFASKQRERAGEGWGLRNTKLRMSRKLIFISGLLICFSCYLNPSTEIKTADLGAGQPVHPLINHLLPYVGKTPLEILADALISYGAAPKLSRAIFDSYDQFLTLLDSSKTRKHLEKLKSSDARNDKTFGIVRKISKRFDDALTEFFLDNPKLAPLTRKYGVF
jgi:hypothetical protein